MESKVYQFGRPYANHKDADLERDFLAELSQLAQEDEERRIHLELDVAEAWCLIANLQLARKHPANFGYAQRTAGVLCELVRRKLIKPGSAMEEAYLRGERDAEQAATN